jgi:hypothetical protein
MSEEERQLWAEFARIRDLPAEEMMPRFVRGQLAPGVEPPPRPPGPAPSWMAKRPAGIRALMDAFQRYQLDPDSLRAFARPGPLRARGSQQSRLLRQDGGAPR